MERYGELDLIWSVGYKGSQLHFVSDETLVYGCGNTLSFIRANGIHVKSLQSHGSGIGSIAVCHRTAYVAYAEITLNPKIFLINYPLCFVKCKIKGGAALEYKDLAFSTDGTKLVSLSGVPDFKIAIWDCSDLAGVEICSVNVGEGGAGLSINPINWKQIVLFGPSRITLWSLEHCGTEKLLTPVEVELPEKTADVGNSTFPKVPPPTSTINLTDKHVRRSSVGGAANIGLFIPPDMSKVYYKESYEEFVRLKEPMEPKSLCWTPKQELYVGCAGGQLMMVDFDSGSATVLVNPQPHSEEFSDDSQETLSGGSNPAPEPPKTAHALLKEGATDCLLLSRRGLFTAGRNGMVQCFEMTGLNLVEEVSISQPVHQLPSSSSFSKLAIGAEDGTIFIANLLDISSSLKVISNHLHTELVGLDMLCPGSGHCVTCRKDGRVQVWDAMDGSIVSSLNLNTECTTIACPLSSKLAMVGTESGHLCMISLVKTASPKLAVKRLMHSGPVVAIRHDQSGHFMVSASTEGPVFFYSSKPSTNFEVLGYLGMLNLLQAVVTIVCMVFVDIINIA